MPLPNFFIIGAPKAGTTAMYHCVRQHPEIYMSPVKEPRYFLFGGKEPQPSFGSVGDFYDRSSIWRSSDYLKLFAGVRDERVIGEATPAYLRSPNAPSGIWKNAPDAKIVAILRQPADRAYSGYLFMIQHGIEMAGAFQQALDQEEMRKRENWFPALLHKESGFYFHQLQAYYELFPREQIKIYLYEDWNNAPEETLRDLFQFLEVDPDFTPTLRRSNVTRMPQNHKLHWIATHPERMEKKLGRIASPRIRRTIQSLVTAVDTRYNLAPPPPIDPEIRMRLTEEYRDDILGLQDLIGRDLSHWLEPTGAPIAGSAARS